METSADLLQRFAHDRDESAFRALVSRYLPLVMTAALRRAGGRRALAEEAAQTAFADLAKRAGLLRDGERLGGWLHQRAIRAAGDLMRSEQRRHTREAEAVRRAELHQPAAAETSALTPLLDAALARLRPDDRDALVLRFLEDRPLREVGAALGLSEDTAQKRVARALEKLRRHLSGRAGAAPAPAVLAALSAGRAEAAAYVPASAFPNTLATAALAARESAWVTFGAFAASGAPRFAAGLGLAAAVWAWPLVSQQQALAASANRRHAESAAADAALAADPVPPRFPDLPRAAPGLSVEEITDRLTTLCEGPFTALAKLHADELMRGIPPGKEGAVITGMHLRLSPAGRVNDELLRIGPRLGDLWAKQQPANTLGFLRGLIKRAEEDGRLEQWQTHSHWPSAGFTAADTFVKNDPLGFLRWVKNFHSVDPESWVLCDFSFHDKLAQVGPEAPEEVFDLYVNMVNAAPRPRSQNEMAMLEKIQSYPVLLGFFQRAELVKNIDERSALRSSLLRAMSRSDWTAAHAMVDSMEPELRARYSSEVALPAEAADLTPFVEWWDDAQRQDKPPDRAGMCMTWALRGDFTGMMNWLGRKESGPQQTSTLLKLADALLSAATNMPAMKAGRPSKEPDPRINLFERILSILEQRPPADFDSDRVAWQLHWLSRNTQAQRLAPESTAVLKRLTKVKPIP